MRATPTLAEQPEEPQAPELTEFMREVQRSFALDGPLARHEPGFLPRPQQDALALAVAHAVEQRQALVAEAGTGVGKTFAYLVPLLLAGRKALVSTATKSLQDQLFLRDLPRLRDALGVPVRLALLKGRSSYLCRLRLQQAEQSAQLPDRSAARALNRVSMWARSTRTGDLAEVDGLDDRSAVIPLVSSTRDNCLGTECPEYRSCHVMLARRDAMAADLVVVNHHLFFADLALRDTGVAELLPTVDAAVFDEAHQLVEAGVQFLGTTLSSGAVIELGRDLLAAGLQHARGLQPWADLQAALEHAARELRLQSDGSERGAREIRGTVKLRWDDCQAGLLQALPALQEAAQAAAKALAAVAETAPDFPKLEQRALSVAQLAAAFEQEAEPGQVRWVDLSPQQVRLVESPLDIREMLSEQRSMGSKAWIFTSATLGDDEALSWFTASTGLEDARKLRVGSPFDYESNARLWVPSELPLPNAPGHPAAVGALAARCAAALGGRCFVLTTTLRVLQLVAQAIQAQPEARDLTVLVQGTEPRRTLLQRFGDGRGKVLVGSQSFWEGIDMPGDALQCVLIDKLPFPPPNDPLVEARVRQLREQGRNPFEDYFVAEAAVSLKQGAGRLIRTESDRGLLVVCDPRMRQMRYGRRLLAALPPMGRLLDEAQAISWLQHLAATHR